MLHMVVSTASRWQWVASTHQLITMPKYPHIVAFWAIFRSTLRVFPRRDFSSIAGSKPHVHGNP